MIAQAKTSTLDKNPEAIKRFLRAQSQALFFAANNHELTNGWFRSLEPAKNIPLEVIEAASSFDPHWSAKKLSAIKAALSPKALENMDKMGEWGVAEKLLPRAPKASQLARVDLAAAVDKELATSNFDWKSVKVRG